jgi:hypothetical protein
MQRESSPISEQGTPRILERANIEFYIGVAIGIIVAVVPMSTFTRLGALFIVLVLLLHIVWRSPWSVRQKTPYTKIAISAGLGTIYALIAGLLIWHDYRNEISHFFGWTSGWIDALVFLPWQWIIPSLAAGALITGFVARKRFLLHKGEWLIREKELQNHICLDVELHKVKLGDWDKIRELVRVAGISYHPEFGKGSPYIDFRVSIFNMSLYDIVINNVIQNGAIRFGEDWEKFYYSPRIDPDNPIPCKSRAGTWFAIHQTVTAEEISRFQNADNLVISFGALEIIFRATDSEMQIETPLSTNHYVETEVRVWRPLDQSQFVFGYTTEQWAEIASGKTHPNTQNATLRIAQDEAIIIPQIKEAHLIPSPVGVDCFARIEVRGKSNPVRVMDYQMKLITREGEYIGRRANVRGYRLIERSGGEADDEGDPVWNIIREETLRNAQLNALVSRTDPLIGWLRFCFEGLPEWETGLEFVGTGTFADESENEQQCPIYDRFFKHTTVTEVAVTVIDSDGTRTEARSNEAFCDQSKTIQKLRRK